MGPLIIWARGPSPVRHAWRRVGQGGWYTYCGQWAAVYAPHADATGKQCGTCARQVAREGKTQ